MNSFDMKPEDQTFFEMTEFYSDLKQKSVSKVNYDNSEYLNLTPKMRNLSDMSKSFKIDFKLYRISLNLIQDYAILLAL